MANRDLQNEISHLNLGLSRPDPDLKDKFVKRLWSKEGVQALEYLTEERKLNEGTIRHFEIGVNDKGDIAIPIEKNGEVIDFKYRSIKDKRFYRHPGAETWIINEEGVTGAERKSDSKTYVILVEGEFDAMSLWQLGYKATISGTGGAQSRAEWLTLLDEKIDVIYICYDSDEAGNEGAQKIAERIGIEKCKRVILPFHKDANELLQQGGTAIEVKSYLDTAEPFQMKNVFKITDVIRKLRDHKVERIPTKFKRFNKYTHGGIPKNSLVILSGTTGIGKSTTLTNLLVDHADNGHPVLLMSLENDLYFTIQRVLETKYKKLVKDFTEEDWNLAKIELADYPFYIDIGLDKFSMKAVDKMVEQAKRLYGIEVFGFDHIHFVPQGGSNIARNINDMAAQFKLIAKKYSLVVYVVSHIKRQDKHEAITRDSLKESSGLAQLADFVCFVKYGQDKLPWFDIDKARMSRSHVKIPIKIDYEQGLVEDDMNRPVTTSFGDLIENADGSEPNRENQEPSGDDSLPDYHI